MGIFALLLILFQCLNTFEAKSQGNSNNGSISGYAFGDYYYNLSRDTLLNKLKNVASEGTEKLNGFNFRRIYFTFDKSISSDFDIRFRLAHESNSLSSDNKISVFVKDAFIKWKNLIPLGELYFGIQPTPSWEITEVYWENRFLEQTIMDLRKVSTSRDFGIGIKGNFEKDKKYFYWVEFANGNGNKPEIDKHKRLYCRLGYYPNNSTIISVYGDYFSKPYIENPFDSLSQLNNDYLLFNLFIGQRVPEKFLWGVETFFQIAKNEYAKNNIIDDRKAIGFSLFGSYYLFKELAIVCRVDYLDPNINSNSKGDFRIWSLLSINYKPHPKVTFSPNVVWEFYEKLEDGAKIKPSTTLRLTFFWNFENEK